VHLAECTTNVGLDKKSVPLVGADLFCCDGGIYESTCRRQWVRRSRGAKRRHPTASAKKSVPIVGTDLFGCSGGARETLPHLTVSPDDVLVRRQLLQAHGASGVELLGGDAHLAAQAELAAVGEAGGAVQVDCGAVDAP